jgi:hypothetical protein
MLFPKYWSDNMIAALVEIKSAVDHPSQYIDKPHRSWFHGATITALLKRSTIRVNNDGFITMTGFGKAIVVAAFSNHR